MIIYYLSLSKNHGRQIKNFGSGEEVEMLGKENGWYKISYEGKTAYVYEDYVKEKEN